MACLLSCLAFSVEPALAQPCGPACAKQNVECLSGQQLANSRPIGRLEIAGGGCCTAWIIAEPDLVITNRHCITTDTTAAGPLVADITTRSVRFDFECTTCDGNFASNCCVSHAGPGCDDAACQAAVCADDPFCCNNTWDSACANAAINECTPLCDLQKPTQVFQVTQLIRHNAALDYCILRVAGNPAATYGVLTVDPAPPAEDENVYEIHHASCDHKGFDDGQVTQETAPDLCIPGTTAEFGVSLVASFGASGSPIFRSSNHCVMGICHCGPACAPGFGVPMSAILPDAQTAIQNAGGILHFCVCGQSGAGNCYIDNGTPGCNHEACCNTVCDADPFCCNTEWDGICADRAFIECGNCGGAGAGDCVVANGTPGCNNSACCEAVCIGDPFCCNTEWDSLCAGDARGLAACAGACCLPAGTCLNAVTSDDCLSQGGVFQGVGVGCAQVICPHPACPGEGNCFLNNGSPGCEDEDCCNLVCDADPFCCNNAWDAACATGALSLCVSNCPGAGSCFASHAGTGCDDAVCCGTVCLVDPFCCNTSWDSQCAAEATQMCVGACCLPDGDCQNLAPDACTALAGTFNGIGSECDGFVCPCMSGRIDFGVTPNDNGAADLCTAAPIPLTTQYVFTQNIVFGAAILRPPVSIRNDASCPPPCRSYAGADFATPEDWWCQFRLGAAPGIPSATAGVTSFSAHLCFINALPGDLVMEGLDGTLAVIASSANTHAGTQRLTVNAPPGQLIQFIRVNAASKLSGVTVDCLDYPDPVAVGCPGAAGDCLTIHDSPGCNDPVCCQAVCAADPFCCDTEWDSLCVNNAAELCLGCTADAGDCCAVHGSPSCANPECCRIVCVEDGFCCDNEWDTICVGEARDVPACGCCPCPGDVSGDGAINGNDVHVFARCMLVDIFASPGADCGCADVDGDAFITLADLETFVDALLIGDPCP